MKKLNFFPYYEEYLRAKTKTATLRLDNRFNLAPNEVAMLTLGWNEVDAVSLHPVRIKDVYQKRLRDLSQQDLRGESPDCRDAETAGLVLGCVYRKVLRGDDIVYVIKFDHLEGEEK